MTSDITNAWERWRRVDARLMKWSPLGVEYQKNGTRLIGRVPQVGPMAWLHEVYAGLDAGLLARLERALGAAVPDEYRAFLSVSNGLNAFSDSLKLCGLPRSSARMALDAREPYDLERENLHVRFLPGLFCLGGVEDDHLYCEWVSGRRVEVFACRKGAVGDRSRAWPDFWTMLAQEVERLEAQFDDEGHRIRA